MFETLSRRSRSLVDQQLTLIDRLERDEEDPDRLESLFELDHIAARMRRNGANLLVLSGTESQREHSAPVAISALVNAAASEVEDYKRVVTDSVPDDEVTGAVAGDLVHLLAELLDNALRYSPPTSQVRVSAVHADHGGMVIEVTDVGLGMAESDLRVANTRLQSGGEVNPFTARHMGLFVVGRLATQHGLVVRLRSTIAGQPDSGTTAGIDVKAELLARGAALTDPEVPSYDIPDDPYGETATALAYVEDPTGFDADDAPYQDEPYVARRNGQADLPVSLLPQRNPGSSGIAGIPFPFSDYDERHDGPVPERTADVLRPAVWQAQEDHPSEPVTEAPAALPVRPINGARPPVLPMRSPVSTAANPPEVSARDEPVGHRPVPVASAWSEEQEPAAAEPPQPPPVPTPVAPDRLASDDSNSIFDKMLSEWLIDDPVELAHSTDLDWKTVWDHGWSLASAAEETPVSERTESGLPVRDPGARLVPGAADPAEPVNGDAANGEHPNGGAPNGGGQRGEVGTESGESTSGHRDPDAVRSSIGSFFGGVHAGRADAREVEGHEAE